MKEFLLQDILIVIINQRTSWDLSNHGYNTFKITIAINIIFLTLFGQYYAIEIH